MEGCFKFQWGGLFFRWGGASFLSGGHLMHGALILMGGTGRGGGGGAGPPPPPPEKNAPPPPPTMGNPVFLVLNILISDPQLPWHSSPEGLRINFIASIYLPNLGLLVDLRLDSILQTRLLHISCKYSISYFHIFIKQPESFIKWKQVFHDHFLTWFVYGSNVSWRYC